MNTDEDLKTLRNQFSNHNANEIVKFNNSLMSLIKSEYEKIESGQLENTILLNELKNIEMNLLNSTFLKFYAYAEEWIFLKIKATNHENLIGNSGSISRFKEPLINLGVDISKCVNWNKLIEAEHIRNCLSHANGNVELAYLGRSKLKRKLSNIIKTNSNYFNIKAKRLYVTTDYINDFQSATKGILFQDEVLNNNINTVSDGVFTTLLLKLITLIKKTFRKIKKLFLKS